MKCAHNKTITDPSTCVQCKETARQIAFSLAQEKFGDVIVALAGGSRAARLATGARKAAYTNEDYHAACAARDAGVESVTDAVIDEIARGLPTPPDGWGAGRAAASYVGRGMPVDDSAADGDDDIYLNPPNGWAKR